MNGQISLLITSLLTGLATSALAQQNVPQTDQQVVREVDMQFTTAFNRQDAAGVAALFAEDGVRVTPQGIIQGRDAIQKDADKRFQVSRLVRCAPDRSSLRELNLGGRGMDHEDRRPARPRLLCNDVDP
jgi:hypothetical protein